MPQTSVEFRQPKWLCEGQYATTSQRRVDGALQAARNGAAILPFGRLAQLNPATNIISPLAGAPAANLLLVIPIYIERLGIPMQTLIDATFTNPAAPIGYPPNYELVEYITMGDVVVWSETAVNPGDPLFYRHTAATAPNNLVGRFRATAVAGETNATAITNARFIEQTTGAGLAVVRVQSIAGLI